MDEINGMPNESDRNELCTLIADFARNVWVPKLRQLAESDKGIFHIRRLSVNSDGVDETVRLDRFEMIVLRNYVTFSLRNILSDSQIDLMSKNWHSDNGFKVMTLTTDDLETLRNLFKQAESVITDESQIIDD
jgi:hypothetical protein